MIIPIDSLEKEMLEGLLTEIVTRDGTDYGEVELATEQKVQNAIRGLQSGRMKLLWDVESESASLLSSEQADKLMKELEQ